MSRDDQPPILNYVGPNRPITPSRVFAATFGSIAAIVALASWALMFYVMISTTFYQVGTEATRALCFIIPIAAIFTCAAVRWLGHARHP